MRSRREDHIPHPESGHHLVLMISCFQIPPRERRPESTPLPCNLGTARAPPPYAENAPISRAPLVRSRREDHIPHLEKHTPIHAYPYTLAKGRWRVPPTNLSSSSMLPGYGPGVNHLGARREMLTSRTHPEADFVAARRAYTSRH